MNPPLTQAPLNILQIKQSPSWKFRLFIIEFALLNFIVAYIIKVVWCDVVVIHHVQLL